VGKGAFSQKPKSTSSSVSETLGATVYMCAWVSVCVYGYIVCVCVDIVRFVLRMWMCGYVTTFRGEGKLSRLDTLKKLVKIFLVLALSGSTVCVCVCVCA